MPDWKYLDHGTRPCELIVCRRNSGGLIEQVASTYPSRNGYLYKLYPTNYRGFSSINQPITVSVNDIDLRRQQ